MLKLPMPCYDVAPEGTPPAVVPPAGPWYAGKADAEIIGHWQNRGWAEKTAVEVAIEATKAHREAERLIGAPAAQIVRLPTDPNDAAGWAQVHRRLGAPAEAKDYDLAAVKRAGDQPLDETFANTMRGLLHAAGVSKSMAPALLDGLVKHLDSQEQSKMAETAVKLGDEKKALEKDWGQNYAVNKAVAANAARAIGLSPEIVDALEKVAGYKSVMSAMLNLGQKIGEDKFITSPSGGKPGVMSVEQAVARRGELMADRVWSAAYLKGDVEKKREMMALQQLITGSEQ